MTIFSSLLIKTYTVFHNLRLEDTNVFPVEYCYETFVWTELLKLLPLPDLKLFLVYLRPYIAEPVVVMNEQIMVTERFLDHIPYTLTLQRLNKFKWHQIRTAVCTDVLLVMSGSTVLLYGIKNSQ